VSRVMQVIVRADDFEVDDEGDIVIWIEIPAGFKLVPIDGAFKVSDTTLKPDEPGIDLCVTGEDRSAWESFKHFAVTR